MEASKEIEMKKHVLGMLKNFMMGEDGGKFKPVAVEVEMEGPVEKDEKSLGSFLKDASKEAPEMEEECEEEMPKKMSPKEFFKRK